jgi:hypothetical protein
MKIQIFALNVAVTMEVHSMTIDEAIIHAEKVMVDNLEKTKNRNSADPVAIQCFLCADEHRQLAEWLKDYKRLLEQEPCDDAISRQAAIDACLNGWNKDYKEIVKEIRALPPVTPQYTEAEIQKMQDLESAEIQKAYEIGKAENPNKWIPVSERLPEDKTAVLV